MTQAFDSRDPQWWLHDNPLTLVDPSRSQNSAGAPTTRSVFGVDERAYVEHVLREPFQWICQVIGYTSTTRRGAFSVGSGFVIGRRTILTAGHNLWLGEQRVNHCWVYPGVDGSRTAPLLGGYRAKATYPHQRYELAADDLFDVAVLVLDDVLPENLVPPLYGAMDWQAIDPELLRNAVGMVSGYPKNTPGQSESSQTQSYQYLAFAELTPTRGLIQYKIDTTAGQSGSPLLVKMASSKGQRLTAVGVHVNGGDENKAIPNSATPITPAIEDFVRTIQRQFEPLGEA